MLLSGDIELNPGPLTANNVTHTNFLSLMSWNLNSLTAHNFLRIDLLQTYLHAHNCDLAFISESHLDDSIDLSKVQINGYSFIHRNHPGNVKRGGVALYFKSNLPLRERPDLEIGHECLVTEICIKRKKFLFVLY